MAIDTKSEFRAIQRYSSPYVGIAPEADGTFGSPDEFAAFAGIYPIVGGFPSGAEVEAGGWKVLIHRFGDPVGGFASPIIPEPFE